MGGTMRLGADPVKLHDGDPDPRALRRGRGLRAPPPPLRGQQPPAHAAGGGGPDLLGHVARRAAGGGDRARRPTSIRSSSPPSTTPSSSRAPSVRRRCSGSSSARPWRMPSRSDDTAERSPRRRRAGHHRLARRRVVRRASRQPSANGCTRRSPRCAGSRARPGASGRARTGSPPSSRRWASRCTRTTAAPRPAPTPGNLLARIPGCGRRACCSARTWTPCRRWRPIEPVRVDGYWENANDGHPRRRQQVGGGGDPGAGAPADDGGAEPPPVGLELLFTVCEEVSLRGSREFDVAQLQQRVRLRVRPRHADRRGRVAAPSQYRIVAEFRGRAAHAGVRPEAGRSAVVAAARAIAAMRLGRLDAETTANVGTDRRRHGDQRRSPSAAGSRPRSAASTTRGPRRSPPRPSTISRTPPTPPNATSTSTSSGCSAAIGPSRGRRSSRWPSGRCGRAATSRARSPPAGASDANSFEAAGFACTNLADGTERNHEPGERISVDALEGLLEVAIALVDEAATELAP